MSLIAGTITINPNGTYSGTGLAKALIDFKYPKLVALFAEAVANDSPEIQEQFQGTARALRILPGLKDECEGLATASVSHLVANAVVTVSVPAGAIDPGVPSAPRSLGGTIA